MFSRSTREVFSHEDKRQSTKSALTIHFDRLRQRVPSISYKGNAGLRTLKVRENASFGSQMFSKLGS